MIEVTADFVILDRIIGGLPARSREIVQTTVEEIKDYAKSIAPRFTGEFAEGIITDYTDPDAPTVEATAPHSAAVHFGSSRNHMAPRPVLQWAVDAITPKFLLAVSEMIGDLAR